MNRIGYIYKITSPSGRIYIGITINVASRKSSYKSNSSKSQRLIHASILKYGWENHIFEVIDSAPANVLSSAEIDYIKKYNSYHKENKNGLNLTTGGEGVCGIIVSEERKIRMSALKKQEWSSLEYRKMQSNAHKGYKMGPSQKKKTVDATIKRWGDPEFREKMKNIHNSNEYKEKQRLAKVGKKMNESHRLKTSIASKEHWKDDDYRSRVLSKRPSNKGIPCSEEQKEEISSTLKNKYASGEISPHNKGKKTVGRPHTEEAKKKISEAKKRYYAEEKRTLTEETKRKISESLKKRNNLINE
jgi:group I intron endonuclease